MRYFITFACYGARLHGDESGSVDRHHNLVGSRRLEPDSQRVMAERRELLQDPYVLDEAGPGSSTGDHPGALRVPRLESAGCARKIQPCARRCGGRDPTRENHERVPGRTPAVRLNRLAGDGPDRKRWARHGSTRWLWKNEDVRHALQYIIDDQGEAMALFVAEEL